jgi:hypothetical protein
MAERFFLRASIIELNWSLEAHTLPESSRSADPGLDRSKVRDESRMPEKLHDRAKMNRLDIRQGYTSLDSHVW